MKTTIFKLFLAILLLGSFACKKTEAPSNSAYPMQMKMTDASGPYDAVYIDVQSVQVVNGNDTGWTTLTTHAGIYNLLKLTNGVDTLLGSATLPSARISQIRLVLGTNNSVVVNGQSYPLKTPSAQQSGLKINVNYTLVAGITYVILLDFDANRSIVMQGNGNYSLKPVIKASTSAASGAIIGSVSPITIHPAIYAISGTDSTGTFTDINGNFMFSGMAAGTYSVAFVPAPPLAIKVINNVTVTVGNVTNIGVVTIP